MESGYRKQGCMADRWSHLQDAMNSVSRVEPHGQQGTEHLIECHACGFQKKMTWKLGARCPKCHSEQFFPKVNKQQIDIKKWKHVSMTLGLISFIVYGISYTANKMSPPQALVTQVLICTEGGHIFPKEITRRVSFPVNCDEKGHSGKTVYVAFKCDQGHKFPLDHEKILETGAPLACPQCESLSVHALYLQDI